MTILCSRESFLMRRRDYSQADDAELLVLTASDPEAFGVFYERFEVQLLGFFWRATGRRISLRTHRRGFAAALESAAEFRPQSGRPRAAVGIAGTSSLAPGSAAGRRSGAPAYTEARRTRPMRVWSGLRKLPAALRGMPGSRSSRRRRTSGGLDGGRRGARLCRACLEALGPESLVRQRVSRGLRTLRARLKETA